MFVRSERRIKGGGTTYGLAVWAKVVTIQPPM